MENDSCTEALATRPRRARIYASGVEDGQRSIEDLLADVLFGAYWHDDYFRTLPPELEPWQLSLTDTAETPVEHQLS